MARRFADELGMRAVEIADDDRAAYHAAASMASNFLVTLEDAAETLLATTGADRAMLVPLVRAALENWAVLGGRAAITGPIVRGDDAGVARQRAAVAERTPELVALFDAMCDQTRRPGGTRRLTGSRSLRARWVVAALVDERAGQHPGAAVVGEVVPRPVDECAGPIAEAHQVQDVQPEPQHPSDPAVEAAPPGNSTTAWLRPIVAIEPLST